MAKFSWESARRRNIRGCPYDRTGKVALANGVPSFAEVELKVARRRLATVELAVVSCESEGGEPEELGYLDRLVSQERAAVASWERLVVEATS